jgi:tRNA A-37 threonylcarbamoyl transferase component Bud32
MSLKPNSGTSRRPSASRSRLSKRGSDSERLSEAVEFIIAKLPSASIDKKKDIVSQLHDGVTLCNLFNTCVSEQVKLKHVSEKPLYFQAMDNLNNFISGCMRIGPRQRSKSFAVSILTVSNAGIEDRLLFTPLDIVQNRHDSAFHVVAAVLALKDWVASKTASTAEHSTLAGPALVPNMQFVRAEPHTELPDPAHEVKMAATPLSRLPIPASFSPIISRMRRIHDDGTTGSTGSRVSETDDDWETDPNWENQSMSAIITKTPPEAEPDQASTAFGTRRGKCLELNCSCGTYHGAIAGGGGPCQNCGHFPSVHHDLGVDAFSALQVEIPGFLIHHDTLRYEFVIGEGSFGQVFKGLLWGKEVAIKKLKFDSSWQSRRQRQDFVKEIKMMASLRHPNVILWMGVCLDPPAIITELLERGSLSDVLHIRAECLNWNQRLSLSMDMCLGVNYLHNLGIVHQDLKSSNLLIDRHYNLKVGDFGLSHFVRNAIAAGKEDSMLYDGAGGTAAYMAPELLRSGQRVGTFKSDVYSVGIILWEIAAQRKPFDGREDTLSMLYHVDENLERPRLEVISGSPRGLVELIQDCWAPSPENRPGMEQVISRLRDTQLTLGSSQIE